MALRRSGVRIPMAPPSVTWMEGTADPRFQKGCPLLYSQSKRINEKHWSYDDKKIDQALRRPAKKISAQAYSLEWAPSDQADADRATEVAAEQRKKSSWKPAARS